MLKDYGVLTLLWLLPVYVVLGLARMLYLALSRRFEDAFDLLGGLGVEPPAPSRDAPPTDPGPIRPLGRRPQDPPVHGVHVPAPEVVRARGGVPGRGSGGVRRRGARAPAAATRGHRWRPAIRCCSGRSSRSGSGRSRCGSFVGPEVLSGGALAAFPADLGDFFRELGSGVRTTVLGGVQPGSPALAGLGAGSWVAFGSTALAQKVLLGAMPALAGIAMYRAMARQTGSPARPWWPRPRTCSPRRCSGASPRAGSRSWSCSRSSRSRGTGSTPRSLDAPPSVRSASASGSASRCRSVRRSPRRSSCPSALFALANLVAGRRRDRGSALVALAALAAAVLAFPVVIAASGDAAVRAHLRDRDDGPVVPAPARARDGTGHVGRRVRSCRSRRSCASPAREIRSAAARGER